MHPLPMEQLPLPPSAPTPTTRRWLHWLQFAVVPTLLALVLILALSACGGGSSNTNTQSPPAATAAALAPASSSTQVLQWVRAGLLKHAQDYGSATPAKAAGTQNTQGGSSAFSATYTIDPAVDELDTLKFDGTTLFVATGSGAVPLAGATPSGVKPGALGVVPGSQASSVRILQTTRSSNQAPTATELTRITLDPQRQIMGMYLDNQRLTTLSSDAYFGYFGAAWATPFAWSTPSTYVSLHDVSQPATPRVQHQVSINATLAQSRRLGDVLYLVTRHTPPMSLDGPAVQPDGSPSTAYANQVAQLGLSDIVPTYTLDGQTQPLFNVSTCLLPNPQDTSAVPNPVITAVTAISLSNPGQISSLCYGGDADGVYMSANAFYLSQTLYQTSQSGGVTSVSGGDTRIHKFAVSGASLGYRGSQDLPGLLWTGAQSDYRLNEYQGYLRAMTTVQSNDATGSTSQHLYVVGEVPGQTALQLLSSLPNASQPQTIGASGDSLNTARFVNERAYVVTTGHQSSLIALDLSDVRQPKVLGSTALHSAASFLHPVSADLLLALGQDDQFQLQVELIRVSSATTLGSLQGLSLGGPGSFSDSLYNASTFAYLSNSAGPDQFALPAQLMDKDSTFSQGGQYQFEVRNKANPAQAQLLRVGSVVTAQAGAMQSALWLGSFNSRSIIQGGNSFFVDQSGVWTGIWGTDAAPGIYF